MSIMDEIFIIDRKRKPQARMYRVTWPCGMTWDYNRFDLDVPVYENGQQSGVSIQADTLAEMNAELVHYGGAVELLPRKREEQDNG